MAFHPYPHLIPGVFNPHGFGPPPGITPASPWTWVDRIGFGSAATYLFALFRLAFASPPGLKPLSSHVTSNSPDHNAKGTQSPAYASEDTHRAPTACTHMVSGSLSLPSSGCFSPFPHGTRALSVTEEYLGLEGGPPMFRQDFTCPALLEDLMCFYPYGAITRYGPTFQTVPVLHTRPLAWSAFARHY